MKRNVGETTKKKKKYMVTLVLNAWVILKELLAFIIIVIIPLCWLFCILKNGLFVE